MNNMQDQETVIYVNNHRISVVKNKSIYENNYIVTLFLYPSNDENRSIKITMVNASNDLESYTSIINADIYRNMKEMQELLVYFDDFPEQLKYLLEQNFSPDDKVYLRLYETENNCLEFGFFKLIDIKELKLLLIPFQYTSTQDMLLEVKKKLDNEIISKQHLVENCAHLNAELNDLHTKYRHLFTNFNAACSKLTDAENEKKMLFEDMKEIKNYVEHLETENKRLIRKLTEVTTENKKYELSCSELKNDIQGLRVGIKYYSDSVMHLKRSLSQLEKKSIPKEKYIKLRDVFSTAVVDLAKYQVSLSKLASLNQLHKTENKQLQDEVFNLMKLINNLEENVKSAQVTSEDVAHIGNLIEQLELKQPRLNQNNSG